MVGNAFQFPNLIGNAFFNNIGASHDLVNFGGKKFSLTAETFAEHVILLAERFNMVENKLALPAQSSVNAADSIVQMRENFFAASDRFGRNLFKPVALPGKNVGNMGYGFAGFIAVLEQHFIGSGQSGAVAFGNGAESFGRFTDFLNAGRYFIKEVGNFLFDDDGRIGKIADLILEDAC